MAQPGEEQLNLLLCPHYSPRSSLLLSPGGPSFTLFVLIIFPYANVPLLHHCSVSSSSLIWGRKEPTVIDSRGAIFGEVISERRRGNQSFRYIFVCVQAA